MAHLVQQWKERVEAVQQELADIKDETSAIHRQREQLKIERNTFSTNSKSEKMRCQEDMKTLEGSASITTEQLATAAARKAEAEKIIAAAQTEYQLDLVQLMNEVKTAEASLASREVPAEALERESSLWCAEEESLRERMRAVERDIVEQRKASTAAIKSAEEEARHAEAELHASRMERNADEGTGPYVFADALARQYPELIEMDCAVAAGDDGKLRKGRSASGRNVGGSNSRKGSRANSSAQPLQQRRVNVVEEDEASM